MGSAAASSVWRAAWSAWFPRRVPRWIWQLWRAQAKEATFLSVARFASGGRLGDFFDECVHVQEQLPETTKKHELFIFDYNNAHFALSLFIHFTNLTVSL